jgi:hypothetical protein
MYNMSHASVYGLIFKPLDRLVNRHVTACYRARPEIRAYFSGLALSERGAPSRRSV